MSDRITDLSKQISGVKCRSARWTINLLEEDLFILEAIGEPCAIAKAREAIQQQSAILKAEEGRER